MARASACLAAFLLLLALPGPASAVPVFGPDFAGDYTFADLGAPSGLPTDFGGLTLLPGDPNTLLIGGAANDATGLLYTVGVTRDGGGHITGFSGVATPYGAVGEYNDGGVVFGPTGVLFTARWPVNGLGQTKPGSLDEDRIDDLGPLGIGGSSLSALNFVPAGFSGAGGFKAVSWDVGNWYDVTLTPDGSGTFDLAATQIDLDPVAPGTQVLPGGPEGFVYIASANAGFAVPSMLVADWSNDTLSAYELDGDGNPLVSTRRNFLTGLTGPEGAFIDPLTGDFLFSTFAGTNSTVVAIRGFVPPEGIPEPGTIVLFGLALAGAIVVGRVRRR